MRILLLSQWFDPEPTLKGMAFARELARRGHEIDVVTGFPNYPGGRVYPGYRLHLRRREAHDGVAVTRVCLYPSHNRSAVGRVANYVSFALSAALVGLPSVRRADVAYVYLPPVTIGIPALVARSLWRIPFVLDIQDLWPDTLAATGMVRSRTAIRAVGAFCSLLYRRAARIAVLSPGFKRTLIARGVSPGKIEVVYNWNPEPAAEQPSRPEPKDAGATPARHFTVVYAGSMGRAQGLSSVLRAAAQVEKRAPHVRFVLVGTGVDVDSLRVEAASLGCGNVAFEPPRPLVEIGAVLSAADALLVHLRDDPLFAITIPSKTQAYLAAGRPIVMAARGDAADLVRAARAGLCVEPEAPDALATAVCDLAAMPLREREAMGARGLAYSREQLSMTAGVDRFESLLRAAAEEL